jgi:hypothetical protein
MSGIEIAGVVTLVVLGSLVMVALIGFWIWTLVDVIKVADDSLFRAGTKIIWLLVILLLGFPGAIIYAVVGRPEKQEVGDTSEQHPTALTAEGTGRS